MSMTPIDILVYIALSEEFNYLYDKLIDELGDGFKPKELEDIAITMFYGNVFSPVLNRNFQLAIVPAGKMGITRAATITSAILSKSEIRDVVVLGIAGALSNDFQPGDVFIPDSVNEYLANSATKGNKKKWNFETSANHFQTDRRLLNRFQMFNTTQKDYYNKWSQDCVKQFELLVDSETQQSLNAEGIDIGAKTRLFVGDDRKLASGPAVGKGMAFVNWIKGDVDRKVAAIEMESAGVYDATQVGSLAHRVIAIRGISDYADERKDLIEKSAKGRFRELAVKNAVSILLRGIEAGLFDDKFHSSGVTWTESRVNSIFVIGGTTKVISDKNDIEPRLNIACYKLGQAIAKSHAKLIVCSPFPTSADYYTVKGYSEVEGDHEIHFHSPNHPDVALQRDTLSNTLQRPGLRIVDWLYPGPIHTDKESWSQAWLLAQLQALEKADVIVAIGGKVSNTVNTLLHLAEARGIPIIPYTFLGGAAQLSFQRRKWDRLNPGFDTSVLKYEQGVERVIEIANRLIIDLLPHEYTKNTPQTFFVSRSSHDSEMAISLINWLRTHGYEVLLGDDEIRVDQMATVSINHALHKSDTCIVLWSKNYALSPWCYDELMLAINRQMNIWFFNIDNSLVVPQAARKLRSISIRNVSEIIKIASDLLQIK